MQPEISEGHLFLSKAKEIWDATVQTLFKMGNAPQIYELKRRIHGTIQEEWHVATYFHRLHAFWQELDHYQNFHATCAADAMKIQKKDEKGCMNF